MRYLASLVATLILSACTTLDLDETVPSGFDLSGVWLINPVLSDAPPSRESLKPGRGRLGGDRVGARPPAGMLGLSFLTQDFPVLAASRVRIEQNRDSLGMDFDRGTYRDVSWGERDRGLWRVQAGWDEGDLVIVSTGEDTRVEERYTLAEEGSRLSTVVSFQIDSERGEYRRVYDRFPSP